MATLVSDSLTHSFLVDLIDKTLASDLRFLKIDLHDQIFGPKKMDCPSDSYIQDNLGPYTKKKSFGPKSEFLGPKNNHFLILTMF